MRDALIVFVKEPRPGAVKTRLAAALGAEPAARLYRALADEAIRRTAPQEGEYRRLFFYTPPEARAALAAWLPAERLIPQRGAGLGERMAAAFAEAFRLGARRTAIIGSDAPWISREIVKAALDGLEHDDLVLGPARDGGYVLLALDRPQPELFRDVAWSTPSVLATTLAVATRLGLSVHSLEALADIDTLEDVCREWHRLRSILPAALARSIERALPAQAQNEPATG